MKNQKERITNVSPDLLNKINQILKDSNDDSLSGVEISGLKFSESATLTKQFWCCKRINGEIVCKWQNKPCNQGNA